MRRRRASNSSSESCDTDSEDEEQQRDHDARRRRMTSPSKSAAEVSSSNSGAGSSVAATTNASAAPANATSGGASMRRQFARMPTTLASATTTHSTAPASSALRQEIDDEEPPSPMLCDAANPKRSSTTRSNPNNISRVATLIKREARPFDEELAHENATMNFLSRINPAIVDSSAMQSPTEVTSLGLDEVLLETTVPLPRTIPIPNAHVKDPASYASHTSKLNPENSIVYRHYETASPIMSPSTHTSMMIMSPVVGKNKRKLSINSEDRYEPYKRRNNSTVIPTSPTSTAMFMSPQTQPMSIPNSPSVSWQQPLAPHLITTPTTTVAPSITTTAAGASSNLNPNPTTPHHHHNHHFHNHPYFSSSNQMQGIQQPLLPGPVMGLMLSGHMGSPMMRRSTSASSAGSMAGDRNISTPSASGVSIFGSNATVPPGSPRVGVVFGGGANVVVASPRGSMHVASSGGAVTPNGNTSGGSQFGQLLNMGGAQDHLSKMSLS